MTKPTIMTFAERPELIDQIYSMTQVWPEFMLHDPVADALLASRAGAADDRVQPATSAGRAAVDPWLRVHVRAGGVVEKVAPVSMVIAGSLAQWRVRTDLSFDTAGPVHVPLALVPVYCDLENDYAVYVEPNVWVRHRLKA